jgi:metal-sulfur cluster biosynthetic enzyme
MTTRERVLEALRTVPEPCSIAMGDTMDICEMGLVEQIDIDGSAVTIELVLTDTSCVHFMSMRRYIADAVMEIDGVDTVEVGMSTRTLWTPDRVRRRPRSTA